MNRIAGGKLLSFGPQQLGVTNHQSLGFLAPVKGLPQSVGRNGESRSRKLDDCARMRCAWAKRSLQTDRAFATDHSDLRESTSFSSKNEGDHA